MNRKSFISSLFGIPAALTLKEDDVNVTSENDIKSTVTLLGPEKLHIEGLRPINANLPLTEGNYTVDSRTGVYYIYTGGKWQRYIEVYGHLHEKTTLAKKA